MKLLVLSNLFRELPLAIRLLKSYDSGLTGSLWDSVHTSATAVQWRKAQVSMYHLWGRWALNFEGRGCQSCSNSAVCCHLSTSSPNRSSSHFDVHSELAPRAHADWILRKSTECRCFLSDISQEMGNRKKRVKPLTKKMPTLSIPSTENIFPFCWEDSADEKGKKYMMKFTVKN